MTWTKTPPTKPGRYGWRHGPTDAILPALVVVRAHDETGELWFNPPGYRGLCRLDKNLGEWWPEKVVYPWEKHNG